MPWQPLRGSGDEEPHRLRGALDRVVRHLGAPSADLLEGLFRCWPEVTGPGLAAHARPVSVRDGVLVVAVDDPAWSTAVRFAEPQLLQRVADMLGGVALNRMEVRVRPRAEGDQRRV